MHLVLIPGFMADASLWDDVLSAFQTLGPISHGDTTRGATIDEMAGRILVDAPERFALIGFSMGGYVAREIARLAPERVQALVLVATSARADTPEQARRKAAAVRLADPEGFTGFSRPGILSSLHPDRASDEAMIERVRAMSEWVGGVVFRRHAGQVREGDLHRLAAIRCPTLVVAAYRDGLRSVEEAEELRDGIDGAELRVIEGSGHMIPFEQPDALAATIVPWLRESVEDSIRDISFYAIKAPLSFNYENTAPKRDEDVPEGDPKRFTDEALTIIAWLQQGIGHESLRITVGWPGVNQEKRGPKPKRASTPTMTEEELDEALAARGSSLPRPPLGQTDISPLFQDVGEGAQDAPGPPEVGTAEGDDDRPGFDGVEDPPGGPSSDPDGRDRSNQGREGGA